MKSVILDTNCFLRLFLDDIPKQADEVEKLIKRAEKGRINIFIPQIILFEINYIFQKYYVFPKQEIVDKLKVILTAPYFTVESKDIFGQAVLLYEKKNISFVDCFLLSKAQSENAELITFDKKLKNLASSI